MNRIIKIGMDVHSTNYNFCLRGVPEAKSLYRRQYAAENCGRGAENTDDGVNFPGFRIIFLLYPAGYACRAHGDADDKTDNFFRRRCRLSASMHCFIYPPSCIPSDESGNAYSASLVIFLSQMRFL